MLRKSGIQIAELGDELGKENEVLNLRIMDQTSPGGVAGDILVQKLRQLFFF